MALSNVVDCATGSERSGLGEDFVSHDVAEPLGRGDVDLHAEFVFQGGTQC